MSTRVSWCLLSLLVVCQVSCATLQSDPWAWLSDPAQQDWKDVVLHAYGREVRFSIPDRRHKGGEHVRRWPLPGQADEVQVITAGLEVLDDPFLPAAQFRWDEYWGGFYKSGNRDFTLSIDMFPERKGIELLNLSVEERIRRQLDYYHENYSEPGAFWTDYFFEHYWVKPYETSHHVWIVENQPQITWHHEYYLIPLTDDIEMVFSFFVREKRWDFKDDPEWRESRWAIVRQIMDTVEITPSPFPDEP